MKKVVKLTEGQLKQVIEKIILKEDENASSITHGEIDNNRKFTLDEVKKAMLILVNIPTSQIADGTYKSYDDAMNFAIQSAIKKQSKSNFNVEYETIKEN